MQIYVPLILTFISPKQDTAHNLCSAFNGFQRHNLSELKKLACSRQSDRETVMAQLRTYHNFHGSRTVSAGQGE